jgi:hypothetical protein
MKSFVTAFALLSFFWVVAGHTQDPRGIYTIPDPSAGGGIALSVDTALTHAMAVEHDRKRVFNGAISPDGLQVKFEHLPTGKYDVVLTAKNRNVFEGIDLGPEPHGLSEISLKNMQDRVATADTFYNRWIIHRTGISEETALLFVERLRDKQIYEQSGKTLPNNLRRFEIIEMRQASDTWQVADTRHLYRETEPIEPSPPFFKHACVAALGSVRVIDQVKNLGKLELPSK